MDRRTFLKAAGTTAVALIVPVEAAANTGVFTIPVPFGRVPARMIVGPRYPVYFRQCGARVARDLNQVLTVGRLNCDATTA